MEQPLSELEGNLALQIGLELGRVLASIGGLREREFKRRIRSRALPAVILRFALVRTRLRGLSDEDRLPCLCAVAVAAAGRAGRLGTSPVGCRAGCFFMLSGGARRLFLLMARRAAFSATETG